MNFLFFLLGLILLVNKVSAQKEEKLLSWSDDYELSWEDYKGKPNKTTSYGATTFSSVGFSIQIQDDIVWITTQSYFDPKKSWTKDKKDLNLLAHEELHFTITELFARQFRKMITERKFHAEGEKLIKEISKLYRVKMKELFEFQNKYDKETNHSMNKEAQINWTKNIKEELPDLEVYSDPMVVINIE